MILRGGFLAVLICISSVFNVSISAQSILTGAPQSASGALDPEDGFLSSTRYTNAYFGFQLDLPAEAHLQPVPMPATSDRRIQLLDLVNPASPHALVSLSAYEYRNKNYPDAKAILRRHLDQELMVGVEELHGVAKTTIAGHQFYYFETRRGTEQYTEFATELDSYVLLAVLQANDSQMVRNLVTALNGIQFFSPSEAARHAGSSAAAYEGPAISSKHLREIKDAAPAEHMDPGNISGNVYHNTQIGMTYEFPAGWSVQPQGGVQESVEHYREKVSGEPSMGPRERAVVKACRRVLLSAWRTKPGSDGDVPYDEFGEVTLSAMPLSCFPNIQFPDDASDSSAVRRFIVGLSLTEPLQRDMSDARSYEAGGTPFVLTRGTIAYKVEGDALSRRISVATAFTQHNGYLLTWLFAAPHDSELRDLLSAKVSFDPGSNNPASGKLHTAPNQSGTAAQRTSSAPPAQAESGSVPPQNTQSSAAPSGEEASTSNSDTNPGTQIASHPSLLRDGEDPQGQQMKGKAIPKKNPD